MIVDIELCIKRYMIYILWISMVEYIDANLDSTPIWVKLRIATC